jgi:hypothetical protein
VTKHGGFLTLLIESREIEKGRLVQIGSSLKDAMQAFTHWAKAIFLNHGTG